jgi:hypothetical protein
MPYFVSSVAARGKNSGLPWCMAANDDKDALPWILSGIVVVVIAAFDIGITFGNRTLPAEREAATPTSPRRGPLLDTVAPEHVQPTAAGAVNPPVDEFTPRYTNQYPADDTDNSYVCDALREEVVSIRQRLRYPYTSPEGDYDYYRARLRDLGSRQDATHCPH